MVVEYKVKIMPQKSQQSGKDKDIPRLADNFTLKSLGVAPHPSHPKVVLELLFFFVTAILVAAIKTH